jgi:hypothetical protein
MPEAEAGSGADSEATPETAAEPSVWGGKRFVSLIYLGLIVVTGLFGYIIGLARPQDLNPQLFGVISLPPTPFGVALYGMVTVALVLGILLMGVSYAAERYDTAAVDDDS